MKRLAQAVREVAEVLPEGGGKGISFRLEHQSLLVVLVEGLVYGRRTAVGGQKIVECMENQLMPIEEKGEIVLYQPDDSVRLEVRLQDETVWLTQQQMAELFRTTKQNVSLHINNSFREGELKPNSVVKESLTTAQFHQLCGQR